MLKMQLHQYLPRRVKHRNEAVLGHKVGEVVLIELMDFFDLRRQVIARKDLVHLDARHVATSLQQQTSFDKPERGRPKSPGSLVLLLHKTPAFKAKTKRKRDEFHTCITFQSHHLV